AFAAPACPPPMPTAAAQALKAAPRDRGMLWRATRGGRSSYLFGTLHVGKPEWRRLGPQTSAALRESDVLALEIDAQDPGLSEAMAQPQAARPLPADLAQRLQQALQRACVPAESMTGLHPVWQVSLLTLLEARWLGMDPAYAQEHLLAAQARSRGMPVVSLETVATQTQALIPQGEDQSDQLLEQSLQQLQDESGRRVLHRLARAWEAGDLAALEDYEAWCECGADATERTFMRRLNDERNPRLADGIEARHAQGQRVFAAVGALHMTGPAGLPRLLRERGFRLERVNFRR
ncbi:MAG TPA: TraB/GumN family protein, partial [Rubrivivax sp.]|nr:TraB/GumN family protein [Rubrivivax sp.]